MTLVKQDSECPAYPGDPLSEDKEPFRINPSLHLSVPGFYYFFC